MSCPHPARRAGPGKFPAILVVLLSIASSAAAAGETPEPVELEAAESSPGTGMNPFVLTDLVSPRLLVEIDWVEGHPPSVKAVTALEETLRGSCDPAKRVEIAVDDEIPRADWERAGGRGGLERLIASSLDSDPSAWEENEVLYVLYVPNGASWYDEEASGMSDSIVFEASDGPRVVPTLLLFTDRIRGDAMMWITSTKVERAILVHELGHALGLVGNPDHVQEKHPRHCSKAGCVMTGPGARASAHNAFAAFFAGKVPRRYCRLCRADIEQAKKLWSESDPEAKAEQVRKLKLERRIHESRLIAEWSSTRDEAAPD